MNTNLRAAGLALSCALLAAAPPASAKDDWVTLRNEMETIEFRVPPGFKEIPSTNPVFVKHLEYSGDPYGAVVIKVAAYTKQSDLGHFLEFIERDIHGDSTTRVPDKKGRLSIEQKDASGNVFVTLVQAIATPEWGYYIKVTVKKEKYDEDPETWDRIVDSLKTFEAPPDAFAVPKDWKCIRNEMYAIMGPVDGIKDKKERDRLEVRLGQVASWLGTETEPVRMVRDLVQDERRFIPKMPIHVLPTAEAFRAEAGDAWVEGARAIYLPDHQERIVVVNGAMDSGLQEEDLVGTALVQYMETRLGTMWPWLRAAFRGYFVAAFHRKCSPGLFPAEWVKRGKEVFSKSPPSLEELMKMDEAGVRGLGADGAVACWGFLQYGFHGPDAPTRSLFRRLLNREYLAGKPLPEAWEKSLADYREETKKTLRLRDLDGGARKYFRDMKVEK